MRRLAVLTAVIVMASLASVVPTGGFGLSSAGASSNEVACKTLSGKDNLTIMTVSGCTNGRTGTWKGYRIIWSPTLQSDFASLTADTVTRAGCPKLGGGYIVDSATYVRGLVGQGYLAGTRVDAQVCTYYNPNKIIPDIARNKTRTLVYV